MMTTNPSKDITRQAQWLRPKIRLLGGGDHRMITVQVQAFARKKKKKKVARPLSQQMGCWERLCTPVIPVTWEA
jgi:hypothetical protein